MVLATLIGAQRAHVQPVGLRSRAQRLRKRTATVAKADLSSAFAKFAKAAPAPPPEAVKFAQSNSIVNTAISIVAFVVGAYAFVVLLNGLRSLLRRTWIKTVENQGPGSLLANLLSTLLNVIGVDLSSVASGAADSSNSPAAAVTPAAAARFLKGAGDAGGFVAHLADRTAKVQNHFPGALAVDDFLSRVEIALAAYGFRGDNSLALTNVCRDESTSILYSKIDEIFGQAFNINGLGGVVTCGVTGIAAGISHAPMNASGRERYVFFAFPHAAVDETGEPASIYRPGRAEKSNACGALLFAVNTVKEEGIEGGVPGEHDPKEPEGSILISRIKEQMRMEKSDPKTIDIVEMTKLTGRLITRDLEGLIDKAVSKDKADYAIITGCQIHSWPNPKTNAPVLEYVMPTSAYVVINGEKIVLDLSGVPPLTPRQVAILAAGAPKSKEPAAYLKGSTAIAVEQTDTAAAQPSPLLVGARKGAAGQDEHKVPDWAKQFSTCC